jgi:hypothetical protein
LNGEAITGSFSQGANMEKILLLNMQQQSSIFKEFIDKTGSRASDGAPEK